MAEFQEKSNFMQTLITAVVGVAVAAVGWSFIKNWMDKRESRGQGASGERTAPVVAARPVDTSTVPSRTSAEVTSFEQPLTLADARKLANDPAKMPDEVVRNHLNLTLDYLQANGQKDTAKVTKVLTNMSKGGDSERYTFLNYTPLGKIDSISKDLPTAQKYFPKMKEGEYRVLRDFMDGFKNDPESAKYQNDVLEGQNRDVLARLIQSMKAGRAQDIKHEAEKTGSLSGLDEKLAKAGLSGYIGSSADVIGGVKSAGVTPVVATAAGGGESIASTR